MRRLIAAAMLGALAACGGADGTAAPASPAAEKSSAYEPMAPFAPLVGKAYRGEWTDPDGTKVVDIARYRLILNGRALESEHRLETADYGGKTIIFFDEGAQTYVFHYFTTAGFHTTGEMQIANGVMTASETVNGHPDVASVTSKATLGADEMRVDAVYIGKDGSETAGGSRLYKPVADPGEFFP